MNENESTLSLVREFLALNDTRRERPLESQEVEKWYSLKQKIEKKLFAHPPSEADRRQSIRLRNLTLPVRYDAGMGAVEAHLQEASEGGMFLTAPDPMPVGTEIQVTVDLRDREGMEDQEVSLTARVIYTNVGHSIGDGAFTGMGLVITDDSDLQEKQKWFKALDRILEDLIQNNFG